MWRESVAWPVLLLAPLQIVVAQAPTRADLQRKLQSCQLPGVVDQVLCGQYEVPEVRGQASSRQLTLNVVLLPATSDTAVADPLVFLAGGGVVPATRYAAFLTRAFPALRRHRDILLLDQRGTWNSNSLACEPRVDGAPVEGLSGMRDCLTMLAQRADLTAYSTAAAMEDLDAVRGWLGYSTINLYGVSYGTKAAQVYMKQFPTRVRVAVLYGVVPIGAPSQLDLAAFAQRSLERVFARCAADPPCQTAFPRLAAEFDSTIARLTGAPVTATAGRADGTSQSIEVTHRTFRNLVQAMLGSARSIERLPLLIHNTYTGNYDLIARAVLGEGPPPPPPAPRGVFFSILCGESILLIEPGRVPAATAGTFFGDAPLRSQMEICGPWPRAALPRAFWEPARGTEPVLAITGDLDPITPPGYADLVTGTLSNARHIVVPNRSHNDVDPCITSLFEQFIIAGGASGLDTRCATAPAPLQFVLVAPRGTTQ